MALRVSFVVGICCPQFGVIETLLGNGDTSFLSSDCQKLPAYTSRLHAQHVRSDV